MDDEFKNRFEKLLNNETMEAFSALNKLKESLRAAEEEGLSRAKLKEYYDLLASIQTELESNFSEVRLIEDKLSSTISKAHESYSLIKKIPDVRNSSKADILQEYALEKHSLEEKYNRERSLLDERYSELLKSLDAGAKIVEDEYLNNVEHMLEELIPNLKLKKASVMEAIIALTDLKFKIEDRITLLKK